MTSATFCRYPEHAELERCPQHGCPDCFTGDHDPGECAACDEAVLCRKHPDHLDMRRCYLHGCPGCFTQDAGAGACTNCDELLRFRAVCPYPEHHDLERCPQHGCPWCFTAAYDLGVCETCDDALLCRKDPDHLDMRRCPMHGCPGCFVSDAGDCANCAELLRFHAICSYADHQDQQRCPEHGCPGCFVSDVGRGECPTCDEEMRLQYARLWPETVIDLATGHDGEDCVHCMECNRCRGTGTVCRHCDRCKDHQTEIGAQCEYYRWDRFLRRERLYWVHSFYDKATRSWA